MVCSVDILEVLSSPHNDNDDDDDDDGDNDDDNDDNEGEEEKEEEEEEEKLDSLLLNQENFKFLLAGLAKELLYFPFYCSTCI